MKNRHVIRWTMITVVVMLVLPFAVARLASECSGMALCMMLFFIVDPAYSAILGFRCGRDAGRMWSLPVISAILFLAGTWLTFDIREIWFVVYASVYLAIGWIAMVIGKYLTKKVPEQKNY